MLCELPFMLTSVTADNFFMFVGWEKGHLSVSLMQGVQVGKALLLALLKAPAEEAQGSHASQYVLHHCLLPCCLQHHSQHTGNLCVLYIINGPTSCHTQGNRLTCCSGSSEKMRGDVQKLMWAMLSDILSTTCKQPLLGRRTPG